MIRAATPADLPSITAIYEHHVLHGTGSFEYDPPSLQEMTTRYEQIQKANLPYLVYCEDGAVLGYAYAGQYRPRIGYKYSVEDSIYVKHDMAGKGIGKALLQELVRICTAKGYRQMIAVIGDIKNSGSILVHRACGFSMVGNLPSSGYKFGRWLDSVQMQRALGEGDSTPPR
jgi:phosphinothricin acetyltransferase